MDEPVICDFAGGVNIGFDGEIELVDPSEVMKNCSVLKRHTFLVQCMPIASILAAAGITQVDFFALDVEGAEMAVLKTFPFTTVEVKVGGPKHSIFTTVTIKHSKMYFQCYFLSQIKELPKWLV